MIKISNVLTFGWAAAIRGMRNPMNSWDKSDSGVRGVGAADYELMKKLAAAGSDHAKFLRMINVTVDINAPLYWWKEFDTYKVGTVANSCSTMHKIHAKEFTLDDFSHEHLNDYTIEILKWVVKALNSNRKEYLLTRDKEYWWQMIQLLPSSYNQLRTVQLNYQVLKNMYYARKEHKLDEWRQFCDWIETLPYSELITGRTDDGNEA